MVSAKGPLLNARVWIDAHDGGVLFELNQVADGENRRLYDLSNNPSTPLPGTLVRSEGGAVSGNVDADDVYDYSGDTYNYYWSEHGRDSFDGHGATMSASVHYCDADCGCPCDNAFWNGAQTVFGQPPFTMDDVVAHEWTHAVTQNSADLIYYKASGAMNESFSDIFGEVVDLQNGRGYDPPDARWLVAESAAYPLGIRNMMFPLAAPGHDPDKMSSSSFACAESDSGGVHSNSAIGNHAFALMVDGGTFNGFTISGIGLTKAGKIEYRALVDYLTPTSDYPDDYDSLQQSCADLIGSAGITADDCVEVKKALDAVEMFAAWPCTCGNGVVDFNEQCDDGNLADGDCCSSLCQVDADGTPCSDGDLCTRNDACSGGVCRGDATPNPVAAPRFSHSAPSSPFARAALPAPIARHSNGRRARRPRQASSATRGRRRITHCASIDSRTPPRRCCCLDSMCRTPRAAMADRAGARPRTVSSIRTPRDPLPYGR